jgi:hypothetical protein
MKSYLLETIAAHLDAHRSDPTEEDNSRIQLLRSLFVQHAFLLNAIESNPECQSILEITMATYMANQRAELAPIEEEKPKIITPDRF